VSYFSQKFDGIVYAVFVSMGFAAIENIMYVFDYGYQTGLVRAFTAVPGISVCYPDGILLRIGQILSSRPATTDESSSDLPHLVTWCLRFYPDVAAFPVFPGFYSFRRFYVALRHG
jgi:hypothetical protein